MNLDEILAKLEQTLQEDLSLSRTFYNKYDEPKKSEFFGRCKCLEDILSLLNVLKIRNS